MQLPLKVLSPPESVLPLDLGGGAAEPQPPQTPEFSWGSPIQPPRSTAVPTGARPAFALALSGKSTLASAPRVAVVPVRTAGKVARAAPLGARKKAEAAVQPAAPVAAVTVKPSRAPPPEPARPRAQAPMGRRRLRDLCRG
ncbi:hypothetical protein NN561_006524 [Cricetulus griseus]